jgi:hypothetical protein
MLIFRTEFLLVSRGVTPNPDIGSANTATAVQNDLTTDWAT